MRSLDLHVQLFGGLQLHHHEVSLTSSLSGRSARLLAYLLLHRQTPVAREHLAFLLWPDSSESQARTNLRHVLHHLRQALPDPDRYLAITSQSLQWRSDTSSWLDIAVFDALAAATATTTADDHDLTVLRDAIAVYTGELLEGWYDDWVLSERERLNQRYLHLVALIIDCLEERGEATEAIGYAERLLRHDSLNEDSYRLLMRLFAENGDRARAIRTYQVCVTTLQRELDVAPSSTTRAAYEALLPATFESADPGPIGRTTQTPLVGRIVERDRLAGRWRAAEQGHAQCVLLTGESGVGKTRLAEDLRAWCTHRGAAVVVAQSYAAEGALAYAPIVEWLRSEVLSQHRHVLSPAVLGELARLLPELRAGTPTYVAPQQLPELEHRQQLFDALVAALLVVDGPLLLVAEDVQWCDRETIQFLHYLLRSRPDTRLFVLATARLEDLDARHPVHDLTLGLRAMHTFTEIEIARLDDAEATTLAQQVAGRPLSIAETHALYRETEGNPLFIVEAVRAGWAGGQLSHDWISPRVQAVIQARFAQLSAPASELLSIAAVIGREFTVAIVTHAGDCDDETLISCLDELWRRRIIREQGVDGYDFTHDKLREVAYGMISPARRRHLHLRTAQALEQLHVGATAPISGQLAAHYERAGAADRAATWYMRAAEAAQQMYAHSEAVRLLQRGIELLQTLPDTSARQSQELAILSALPGPLVALEGYQSVYVTQVQERAVRLAAVLNVEPDPPLLWSLAVAHAARGDLVTARSYGEQMLAIATRANDDVLLVQSEYVLGIAAYWNAEFVTAKAHFEAVIERFNPRDRRAHLLHYGQDPAVICQMRRAFTLWFLGHTADARHNRDEAVAQAIAHADWFTRLSVLHFAGLLSLELGDQEHLRECVAILASHRTEHDEFVHHNGEALSGYVDVLDGHAAAGIARIERVFDDLRPDIQLPGQQSSVARVLLAARAIAGDAHEGLAAADTLLSVNDGCRIWDAEAHRHRADSMASLGASRNEIEAELALALHIAHQQQSSALELRIELSRLRYRLAQADRTAVHAARDRLAMVMKAIADGSDSHDLREAMTLLAHG